MLAALILVSTLLVIALGALIGTTIEHRVEVAQLNAAVEQGRQRATDMAARGDRLEVELAAAREEGDQRLRTLADELQRLNAELANQAPSLVGKTVVVNTRNPDDQTFRGVVHGDYTDRVTLRDVLYVAPGGDERPLGGLHHLDRNHVSSVQEIMA
jgi:hypothetical protein